MKIQDSPVCWRFEDESTDIDLSRIDALSSAEAGSIWYAYISNVDHLMKIMKDDPVNYIDVKDFYIDSDNPDEGKEILLNECPFFTDKHINVLWGPETGVRLSFSYFVQYWDDFIYPGDESIIISDTENGNYFLQICDEHVFVTKMIEDVQNSVST